REGAEAVLFLWGLLTQAATTSGWASAFGAVLGLITAASLGWAIFRGGRHVSLQRFFGVTSIFLLLLAAGMFSTGIGRLEVMGFLPATPTAWHPPFLLDDHGFIGGFLNGLIGYRSRPSLLQAPRHRLFLAPPRDLLFRSGSLA